jgi:hypothetical protein
MCRLGGWPMRPGNVKRQKWISWPVSANRFVVGSSAPETAATFSKFKKFCELEAKHRRSKIRHCEKERDKKVAKLRVTIMRLSCSAI